MTTPATRHSTAPGRLTPSLDQLMQVAQEGAAAYASAQPYPHAVIDGLFSTEALRAVATELPPRSAAGWTTWDTTNEWKHVFDRPEFFGPNARRLADDLNSSEFVRFLERLTGIDALVPDPHLTAAGYFDVRTGGFLNVHVDFARNPKLSLVRRVNVLVYLNEGWQEDWGGLLELRGRLDGGVVQSILPVLNRMVVFSTPGAAHGHPRPVAAPEGRSRLCFSAYYFTSPDLPDSPFERHGVLFSEAGDEGLSGTVRRFVPPIAIDGAKAVRRRYRRSRGSRLR